MKIKVHHDPNTHRFYAKLDHYEACLHYVDKGDILDFCEIDIPEVFRNHGVATELCIEAFKYVDEKGLKVVPTDDFIRTHFLPHHPQYEKLIQPGEYPYT